MKIALGVLALQGDVRECANMAIRTLEELEGGKVLEVKTPDEIDEIDGLIIPGGESTTIGQMAVGEGMIDAIKTRVSAGMHVLGTCAGLILLARGARDRVVGGTGQPLLGLLDISVERNAFGRQHESFEADLSLSGIGIEEFPGIFIRAPSITETGSGVKEIASLDGKAVAVMQGNVMGTSFHPELTRDTSLYKYFAGRIIDSA